MRWCSLLVILTFAILGILLGVRINPLFHKYGTTIEISAGIPERLIIPKIGVDAAIEQVGLDPQRRMDIPKNVYNVGWYRHGTRPGETGNAVMDGHVDTPNGTPSVFADLQSLTSGDKISVIDKRGKEYKYQVTSVARYKLEDVPLKQIFDKTKGKNLVLITCAGEWNRGKKDFTERAVAYAKFVE